MNFGPKEAFAKAFNKSSPIHSYPSALIVFVTIYITVSIIPRKIIRVIFKIFIGFIGFLQGANQVRFYTLMLRNIKGYDSIQLVPMAIGFGVLDQCIEFFLRPLLSGVETKACTGMTIVFTIFSFWAYYVLTTKNQMSHFLPKTVAPIIAGLALVLMVGIQNACFAVWAAFAKRNIKKRQNKKLTKKATDETAESAEDEGSDDPNDKSENHSKSAQKEKVKSD